MSNQTDVKFRLNNSELWGGLIGLALGGFVIWSGLKLKLGTINDPGSGFVLFYTGILMCLFAASIIIAALTEGGPTFGSRWVNTRWTKPLLVIVCLIAFSFALNPLGFLLSSIPLMLLLLRVVDPGPLDAGRSDRSAGSARHVVGPQTPAPDPIAFGHLRNRLIAPWTHSSMSPMASASPFNPSI